MNASGWNFSLAGGGDVPIAEAQQAVSRFLSNLDSSMRSNAADVIEALGLESASEKAEVVRTAFDEAYRRCARHFGWIFAVREDG